MKNVDAFIMQAAIKDASPKNRVKAVRMIVMSLLDENGTDLSLASPQDMDLYQMVLDAFESCSNGYVYRELALKAIIEMVNNLPLKNEQKNVPCVLPPESHFVGIQEKALGELMQPVPIKQFIDNFVKSI